MAVNTQFSIAVHIMVALAYAGDQNVTSSHLAMSVNTSPSFVRRILAKLSKVHLVETATGKAGSCWLAKDPTDISLRDIYEAVEAPRVFSIHTYTEQRACTVSCHIKSALQKVLEKTQHSMEANLAEISLGEIVASVAKK